MNAYKVETVLTEDGTLKLQGLPFHAGDVVEVIIRERAKLQRVEISTPFPDSNQHPLRGKVVRYDDPFEPAVPLEDWEALH
ncbi:MAG: hypothetical protein H0X31_21625 [Nostocaceae cyanobacterium]|nr:hypothetical protein [Nostocaceae cyanobacterium]